ncbi:hypothetical protein EPUS_08872 [Endocarpon pusillum Z07020]|uniref:6,7-dimethyl-8-ribityllumazine synthase n=1 Tax=Endocarpon pusillum (strain Z07020 / HMAS-L-300199) TaxID=1263415 RepID=U1GCA1_ENDPU|nr:uncharacterized protein EPUS_08872 [Endocarpon pusillum Z07020]ERF75202.1 hypothetical protein EPUS_08872 [Endocarpon pusillum Z07020]
MASHKGPGAPQKHEGSSLRIAIIHARWNTRIVSSLVSATRSALLTAGVSAANIITESVPGSYELPFACQKVIAASQIQASSLANIAGSITAGMAGLGSATQDLLGGGESSSDLTKLGQEGPAPPQHAVGEKDDETAKGDKQQPSSQPFDAVIAVGVLIKGETMHFEYIADAVSHGLMRVQLDTGVPVVFGLLTVLTEEQGMARAGMIGGHNHGEDWGNAAVELGNKRRGWAEGRFS